MLSWAHPCYHFAEYTKGKQLCDGGKGYAPIVDGSPIGRVRAVGR